MIDKHMDEDVFKIIKQFTGGDQCESCGLFTSDKKSCPKCGRMACDKCIAVDNSDCMFCGTFGEIAQECFRDLHKKNSIRY